MKRIQLTLVVLSMAILCSCVQVGTGKRIVIKELPSSEPKFSELASFYPEYFNLSMRGGRRSVSVVPGSGIFTDHFLSYRRALVDVKGLILGYNKVFASHSFSKYGAKDPKVLDLSLLIRRTETSPGMATGRIASVRDQILKVSADSSLSKDKKADLLAALNAIIMNQPEADSTTALHHIDEKGYDIFYYYPRLSIDVSAELHTPRNDDSTAFIGTILMLDPEDYRKGVRILDFSPKGADILDYTRGLFKQSSTGAVKATYGQTQSSSDQTVQKVGDDITNTLASARGMSLGGEASYTYTEGFERDLKEAIAKRTNGILEGGRGFYVDLRGLRNIKVSGSYSFDLMLEVPSEGTTDPRIPAAYFCKPVVSSVKANALVVGVARHVYDKGMTGFFNRVPEAENDDVFEQVASRAFPDCTLWNFATPAYDRPLPKPDRDYTIKISTNVDEAAYVAKIPGDGGKVIGSASGKEGEIRIPYSLASTTVEVQFMAAVIKPTEGSASILKPNKPVLAITVPDSSHPAETLRVDMPYDQQN